LKLGAAQGDLAVSHVLLHQLGRPLERIARATAALVARDVALSRLDREDRVAAYLAQHFAVAHVPAAGKLLLNERGLRPVHACAWIFRPRAELAARHLVADRLDLDAQPAAAAPASRPGRVLSDREPVHNDRGE